MCKNKNLESCIEVEKCVVAKSRVFWLGAETKRNFLLFGIFLN